MKKAALLLITLLMITQAAGFEGLWYTKGNESVIEIKKVGNQYQGAIVWLQKPYSASGEIQRDTKNPNKSLRKRPIQDLIILKNFTLSKGVLKKGKIYDPDSGKTYKCTMKIKNNRLEVHGYIGVAMLGRTEKWNRCNNLPESIK